MRNLFSGINLVDVVRKYVPWITKAGVVANLEPEQNGGSLVQTDLREKLVDKFLLKHIQSGYSVFFCKIELIISDRNLFDNYVIDRKIHYISFSATEGLMLLLRGNVLVKVDKRNHSIKFEMYGPKFHVDEYAKTLEKALSPTRKVFVEWVFDEGQGSLGSTRVPLTVPPILVGAYPWLGDSTENFTKKFMESSSAILVLIGPPGTGKTTLIKEIVGHSGSKVMVTYDTKLLFTDGFFMNFLSDENCGLLVLEDADTILESRRDGNTMMHKFLNASDGLVSIENKKIIFSTNLPSIRDIDPALLRKGRCFGVVNSRTLSFEEARMVAEQLYPPETVKTLENKSYTLAEITNLEDNDIVDPTSKVGF